MRSTGSITDYLGLSLSYHLENTEFAQSIISPSAAIIFAWFKWNSVSRPQRPHGEQQRLSCVTSRRCTVAHRDSPRSRTSSRSARATRVPDTDAKIGSVLPPLRLAISWVPHYSRHKSAKGRKVCLCDSVD